MIITIKYAVKCSDGFPFSVIQININEESNCFSCLACFKSCAEISIVHIANLCSILNLHAIKLDNGISMYINDILHVAVNVCTVGNCYISTFNCVDTVFVCVIRVSIYNVECAILDGCIEIGSDHAVCAVVLNGTTVKYTACGRTAHCSPTNDRTILVRQVSACFDSVEVERVNACRFERYVFEYEVTLSICPSLCVAALDVNILKSEVFKSTGESAFEENFSNTFNGNACLHRRHCVRACEYVNRFAYVCICDSVCDGGIILITDLSLVRLTGFIRTANLRFSRVVVGNFSAV